MMDTICSHEGRDELLMAYLYDEIEPAQRAAFGAHLGVCGRCARELAALRGVRAALSAWAPPEALRGTAGLEPRAADPGPPARSWHDVPGWAQVAAALLVLGVSAAIANVEVRHDSSGWTLRTGWSAPAPAASKAAGAQAAASAAPWRADLAALEQRLGAELRTQMRAATAAAAPANGAELERRLRAVVDESERRQQRSLALAVGGVVKDFNSQREADLVKIDRSLGFIQSSTYGEQLKQRELVNYLIKASQKQ